MPRAGKGGQLDGSRMLFVFDELFTENGETCLSCGHQTIASWRVTEGIASAVWTGEPTELARSLDSTADPRMTRLSRWMRTST